MSQIATSNKRVNPKSAQVSPSQPKSARNYFEAIPKLLHPVVAGSTNEDEF
jgi:hypothetical protein